MEVDAAGRIYLAGYICEPGLPVTANAAQRAHGGNCDGFVAILGPDRRLEYATYLGGTQQERIAAIAVDEVGTVYVAGDTTSSDFPTTAGAFDQTLTENTIDTFVTKISPAGAIVYSTLIGGLEYEFPHAIEVDTSGRAHVVGYTRSPDFPATPGAVSGTRDERDDAFYTRVSASGSSLSYSTFIGGAQSEYAIDVALDSTGAVYVAGGTESLDLPAASAFQPSNAGSTDAWLMKIGADDRLRYLTYFGGNAHETVQDMTVLGTSVFLAGDTCSPQLPSAPARAAACGAAYVTKIAGDGSAVQRTVFVENISAAAFAMDPGGRAYIAGYGSSSFVTTPDAFQSSPGVFGSPLLVALAFEEASKPLVEYATYAGGGGPFPRTLLVDGAGGVFLGALFNHNDGHLGVPVVNAPFSSVSPGGVVMHFVPESRMVDNVPGEIVMYARDVAVVRGNWRLEQDFSAALGRKLRNPNVGAAKLAAPRAAPADYVDFQFHAEAGVNYHLWLRGRADGDHWANDSVFVQFSDSVDPSGAAAWRIGSTSAATVNLEDYSGCGIKGWGWQDNGYGVLGVPIRFSATGMHTLRVQPREDGYAFDQIVLSSSRFLTRSPGPFKEASTVLARSNGQPAPAASEIVLHMTDAQTNGMWRKEPRAGAASGIVVRHPDTGAAKVATMPVPAVNYFELAFDAEADRAYRLWIRGIADRDYWGNDSVHVQFSDSVDASGAARWRIGSASSTEVNLEDCSGCGLRGWGWQDNGWGAGVRGPEIRFASTGRHVIRVTTREDGFSIDQIVLSPVRFVTASPGTLKDDTTILARTQ